MENKKRYSKPILESETFIPQNYIAACGDTNKVYKFKCDAPTEWGMGYVIKETDGREGVSLREFLYSSLGLYHPCGKTHDAPTTDTFIKGYYVHDIESLFNATPIIIWRGENGDDIHCTINIHMDEWETTKS